MTVELPDWVTFPEDDWVEITIEEAGLDPEKFEAFVAKLDVKGANFGGEDHCGNKYDAVITRGGYLVHTWGDQHYRHHNSLTWRHLIGPRHESLHYGGFPIELGTRWQEKTSDLEIVSLIRTRKDSL